MDFSRLLLSARQKLWMKKAQNVPTTCFGGVTHITKIYPSTEEWVHNPSLHVTGSVTLDTYTNLSGACFLACNVGTVIPTSGDRWEDFIKRMV